MNYHYLECWVLLVRVLVVVAFAVAMSSSVNAKTEKQVEVTPVQDLQYYGVFPHGVSSFETDLLTINPLIFNEKTACTKRQKTVKNGIFRHKFGTVLHSFTQAKNTNFFGLTS